MALSTKEQFGYWGLGFVLLLVVFYFLGSAIMPFLVGAGLAYVLDPVADRLEAMGLSRLVATAIITVSAILLFLITVIVAVPFLIGQATSLFQAVPNIMEALRSYLETRFPGMLEEGSALREGLNSAQATISDTGLGLLNSLLTSSLVVFDFLLLLVVSPVVAFYLLYDWDNMVAKIDSWLPRDHRHTVRKLASDVDGVLAAFMRGQLTVMIFLAAFYSIGLMLIGLEFGAVVGIFAGLISFIPFVGSLLGGALALGLAVFQFWGEWWWILAVLAVFGAGQFIEGNILTPYLVGSSVGLHPVWLMFALSAFGVLFGFFGLLIAVPAAAALGVLARFALAKYLDGRLYKGLDGNNAE